MIISGDQDYVPAVQAVKDLGKKVANVSFLTRGGKLSPGGARVLNEKVDHQIELNYEEFEKFLNFSRKAP